MSLQTVARRYATALADVAIDRREEKVVQNELDQWSVMIESAFVAIAGSLGLRSLRARQRA